MEYPLTAIAPRSTRAGEVAQNNVLYMSRIELYYIQTVCKKMNCVKLTSLK